MQPHHTIHYGARLVKPGHSSPAEDCRCLQERPAAPFRSFRKHSSKSRATDRALAQTTTLERALPGGAVQPRDLQTSLFVVLALYASVGVMNLTSEWSVLARVWPKLIEFLANGVLTQ